MGPAGGDVPQGEATPRRVPGPTDNTPRPLCRRPPLPRGDGHLPPPRRRARRRCPVGRLRARTRRVPSRVRRPLAPPASGGNTMTRSRASARKAGSSFETLIAGYLAATVDDRIERRTKNGNKDR